MLLFIILEAETFQDTTLVSIHHMLLFILAKPKQYAAWRSFNTSHVTLYRFYGYTEIRISVVSIHHMLLFIKYYTRLEYHRFVFQYITCYSLSANIYRGVPEWLEFQYITCYSLSEKRHNRTARKRVSIHHMLLFIVISLIDQPSLNDVSIHHMLLFILTSNSTSCLIWWFQYITCYSLSVIANMTVNQIHLFQYITCYSLSALWIERDRGKKLFQYITCYSLSRWWEEVLKNV